MKQLGLKAIKQESGLVFVTCERIPYRGFLFAHTDRDGPKMLPKLRRALREYVNYVDENCDGNGILKGFVKTVE